MGKLGKNIALLNRNSKQKINDAKKQEIKPKRRKRKKDLEKLHRNALGASKDSLIKIYRNGAKGKEVRKGKLQPNKFYKARLQGEVAKFLDQDSSEKSEDVLELLPNTVRVDCTKKDKLFENIISSDEDIQCQKKISKKHLINSKKFTWSAMFRYEEFCAMICSENFDDHDTIILPNLPDPILKVKENLKRIHMNAMCQHFSRPDVKITDYIDDKQKDNSSKSPIIGNDIKNETNKQSKSYVSSDHSESLTADAVEDSHLEISPKFHCEIDDKIKSNNFLFSIPKNYNKIKVVSKKRNFDNNPPNFQLPLKLFDRPISTITSSTDDENNCERCVKHNMKSGIPDDKILIKNNRKYIPQDVKRNQIDNKKSSKIDFLQDDDHHMNTYKFINNLEKDSKKKHKIRESYKDKSKDDDDLCKNLNARAMIWKSTKNFKHVPTILRRSICDPTNISNLTYILNNNKQDGVKYFQESSNQKVDFNFNISSSVSSNENNSIIKTQYFNDKYFTNKHRAMPLEEESPTMHRTLDFCVPVEKKMQKKKTKSNINKETKKSMQFHEPQKSVTFSKKILFNADPSTQSHYSVNHNQIQPIKNVRQTKDKVHLKNCQILRQEIRNDNQPFLLRSTKSDLIYQPEVKFINPSQCDAYTTTTTENCQDNNDNKPVYFQIINQSIKPSNEQKLSNQGLASTNNKSNNLRTYGQTLSQSIIQQQQPAVPITSQNIQFMFRKNDPHVYAFSELQNLQLLTLNDNQNVYVNALNSVQEQKRTNECAILPNIDQPTKYFAIEKDLNAQRIPIYFHNNDQTIGQQYMPCQMITTLEKQNNNKVFFRDPTSKVIFLQGNHLNDRNHQFVE
ncbi:PREDICTED: uncharacterized protein LOC106790220 [Polistes canadensis]|uniref:uncharacterized protein LOC106790220 n=1 Tax=Polistes canadensis TaxID=91411 RepID=UPI000718BAA0|nr:PREDICTED: uncharacterized protein LOC106790220 [Polistes canadensis]